MLLTRRPLGVEPALEHLVGVQAQEPQAPYIGLWSRLEAFEPQALSELIAERGAVRGTLMRSTIHLVTTRDWVWLRPLIGPVLARHFRGSPFSKGLAGVDLQRLRAFGRELLSQQPRTRAELSLLLAARWRGVSPTSLAYAITYLEPLVQVPPRGLWRRGGQARWTTAEAWFGPDRSGRASIGELVRRYLAAYGPATVQDIQSWSGLTRLGQAVAEHRSNLRAFRDEHGRELLDLAQSPLPDPSTPAPPRFLAPFDNAILAHADRSRIICEGHRQAVSRDRLMRTFLVDGFVAGTWSLVPTGLEITPLRPLRAGQLRAIADEAEGLIDFLMPDAAKRDIRFAS